MRKNGASEDGWRLAGGNLRIADARSTEPGKSINRTFEQVDRLRLYTDSLEHSDAGKHGQKICGTDNRWVSCKATQRKGRYTVSSHPNQRELLKLAGLLTKHRLEAFEWLQASHKGFILRDLSTIAAASG